MRRITRRSKPDTILVRVGRVPAGGIVTRVPGFDNITPLGLARSTPDKEAWRQRVRQLVAEQAERGTLSGAAAQFLDRTIGDWLGQWNIAAHEAYLDDLTGVESLIAGQAGEHADRVGAQVAALRSRLDAEVQAHKVAHHDLTGQDPPVDIPPAGRFELSRVLPRDADRVPDAVPAQPTLVAIEGGGG